MRAERKTLEPIILGELLSPARQEGRNPEEGGRHKGFGHSHRDRPCFLDGGEDDLRTPREAEVSFRFLWMPSVPIGA